MNIFSLKPVQKNNRFCAWKWLALLEKAYCSTILCFHVGLWYKYLKNWTKQVFGLIQPTHTYRKSCSSFDATLKVLGGLHYIRNIKLYGINQSNPNNWVHTPFPSPKTMWKHGNIESTRLKLLSWSFYWANIIAHFFANFCNIAVIFTLISRLHKTVRRLCTCNVSVNITTPECDNNISWRQ